MTDENRTVEEKHECLCQNKAFRKFVVISAGTFVGVFLALSLFAALHKPPMPPMHFCPCQHQMMKPDFRPHHFDRGDRSGYHKKFDKHQFDKPMQPREFRENPEKVK